MDSQIKREFEKSKSKDKEERYEAYHNILKVTEDRKSTRLNSSH